MTVWRPLGRPADEPVGTLYEGVPAWMKNAVQSWVYEEVRSDARLANVVDEFDQIRRAKFSIAWEVADTGFDVIWKRWDDETDVIPFVDFLLMKGAAVLHTTSIRANVRALERRREVFEANLLRCSSAWKVGTRDGFPGLERRLPLGVQEAADHILTTADDAGARLSEAWHAAFGVNTDPSKAYGLAIKAVEDAAKPVVSPNDGKATLGKMIGVMQDQGWVLPLQREDSRAPTSEVLLGMMRALWTGQVDRHGGPDNPQHRAITQDAAQVAVMLAVPLVQWFKSGVAERLT